MEVKKFLSLNLEFFMRRRLIWSINGFDHPGLLEEHHNKAMQCKVINIQLWLSDFVYNNECSSHQEYVYSRIRGVILIFAIAFNGTLYYNCENLKVTNNFHETTSLNWTEIVTELYLKKI